MEPHYLGDLLPLGGAGHTVDVATAAIGLDYHKVYASNFLIMSGGGEKGRIFPSNGR